VNSLEDTLQIVRWYPDRWRVEDVFASLKTRGLDVEQTRLYRFRLIFRQRPPVKQGLLGDPIKLSFKQFALFSNSFK